MTAKRATSSAAAVLVLVLLTICCRRNGGIPEPGSKAYGNLISAFYIGLAGLQAGEDVRAREGLSRASELAPGEPATWANLALLELRQQQYDQAIQHGEVAQRLAPRNDRIQILLGLIESKRGNLKESTSHFREAVSLNPTNAKALYALAGETERQGSIGSDGEARKFLVRILQTQPNNQAVLLDTARLSAKSADQDTLTQTLSRLQALSAAWPEPARHQLDTIRTTAGKNARSAAVQIQFLRNLLVRDVAFRRDLDAVRAPSGTLGEPFPNFLRIEPPSSLPAPSDTSLHFELLTTADQSNRKGAIWAGAFFLDAKADPKLVWADRESLHLDQGTVLPLPGRADGRLATNAIVFGDLNYDFKTDIVMATPAGLRLFQQGISPLFSDVTAKTKLAPPVVNGSYTGAWLFDVDLDGDLDIVLGRQSGTPIVLRNNGDGSFVVIEPFTGISGMRAFADGDIDGDGDPDVAIIDGNGSLHTFTNDRLGNYRIRVNPLERSEQVLALATGDVNGDGLMDFVVLTKNGRALRISDVAAGTRLETAELLRTVPAPEPTVSLVLTDLDNNGSLDLVIGRQVFLHDAKGFAPLQSLLDAGCVAVLDLNSDGRLDLLTLSNSGIVSPLLNRGTRPYKWQILRTRAAQTSGDQRINSYGIGGEVEVRSGLLTQKQEISSPQLHFGLGENTEASLARIVWPNGQLQVEFDLKPNATALAQQRLKGSCPFLFAWNGERMQFVKDCAPWSPALGLHVNAQQVAGIGRTQEWFKIPGDQVKPHNGIYDLRVTGEYWETFYIDYYSFLAVDHPPGTEVFTDERFAVPSPPLKLYATGPVRPFSSATDDAGRDVSEILSSIDSKYLDSFGRGRYQGVTRDHWVQLDIPSAAPETGPLYLIGTGWLHPTDATINVALGQSNEPSPQGLSIEVMGRDGSWRTAKAGLGFPAGRLKNVVLDLSGIFAPGAPRRLRLRTNLEIFWDRLGWAVGVPESSLHITHLQLRNATLGYRGFSRISQANPSSPELPDYDAVERRGPQWRDLEGYYTRFGDVLQLIEKLDDRILITNAGDELKMEVAAPPPPQEGWSRDLIMVGDGWIKDGDYNSVFSKTVLPLPYHGLKEYTVDSRSLEEDPAYKRHPEDWRSYHTRYVGRESFVQALWR